MGLNWKLTVVGGAENGTDVTLPSESSVIVGRSHTATLRLSEPDVSGKHLEFTYAQGEALVRNLSRYASRLNGREFPTGETSSVAPGDVVEIGRSVKIRIDDVPAERHEAPPPETSATQGPDRLFADVPTAVMEESTMTSQGGSFLAHNLPATFATHAPDVATRATHAADVGTVTEVSASAEETDTGLGDETVVSGEAPAEDRDADTQTDGGTEDGETRELETRIGSIEELMQRRKELDRKTKRHKVAVVVGLALFAAFLGGLWFVSRTTKETNAMTYPKDSSGRPDSAWYVLRDANGRALVEVDYPRNPKISVTPLPHSNGVSVVSYMGRDRDVPFYLQLEAESRAEELRIDLLQSVRKWLQRAEASAAGFVFDERMKDDLRVEFFEDVFPDCCQEQSLYGVRFVTFDYKRTWPDGKLWHGILIYFRRGDTVYVHRREIPEESWERGGYRIRQDPNIAIYSNFIESYWESPGLDDLPVGRPSGELLSQIRQVLSKERASDWRFLKKDIDAVLITSWRDDPRTRQLAEGCLRQFREVLKTYYYGKFNAYQNAKDNRNTKKMFKIRKDCEMVFDCKDERYYFLVSNPEVW